MFAFRFDEKKKQRSNLVFAFSQNIIIARHLSI